MPKNKAEHGLCEAALKLMLNIKTSDQEKQREADLKLRNVHTYIFNQQSAAQV